MARTATHGRHRLGTPGLVHCVRYRPVSEALAEYRRTWLTGVLVPAKHSLAGLRRRAQSASPSFTPAGLLPLNAAVGQ